MMSFQSKVITGAQITVVVSALQQNNVALDQFLMFATKFNGVKIDNDGDKLTVVAESLSTLVEFERQLKEMVSDTLRNSTSLMHSYISQGQLSVDNATVTSNVHDIGAVGFHADTSSLERVVTPFPQPANGYTVSENSNGQQVPAIIKRKFGFPEGQIQVPVSGNVVKYSSFKCIIKLPLKAVGLEVDALLKRAFIQRKLFYIGRDIRGSGFVIQSAYQLLPSNESEQAISGNKLAQMKRKLLDLGIELSEDYSQTPTIASESSSIGVIAPGPRMRQQEPEVKPPMKSVTENPLKSSSVSSINKSLRFPQPGNLVLNSEFHRKNLRGFEGDGAIHMYFRFDGGRISNEYGDMVQYPSYIKTACLPGNSEGRRLFGMIEKAANSKKLFVIAHKFGEFKLRSKVRLLNSDDYPQDGYLRQLFEELSKLGIQPLTYIPPLPVKVQAHHGESSDDEEEEEKLEALRKGGPFEQPEKGIMRLEKDPRTLNGFAACDAVMVYVRFAGGKMKVKGYKPSKSFEIQYSQANIVAALPGSDQGKMIAAMLHTAFQRRQLFIVEKKDGEPSFRVRPKVHLITAEQYPRNGYLMQLKRQLMNIGIPEPSQTEVANLVLHDSKSMRHGTGMPPTSPPISPGRNGFNTPVLQPHPMPRNAGARPKQRLSQVHASAAQNPWTATRGNPSISNRHMGHNVATDSSSNSSKPNSNDDDKCPICLGSLSQMPQKKLGCGHEFHQTCVDMALKAQPNNCPYCKQPVTSSTAQPAQVTQTTRVTSMPNHLSMIYGNQASLNVQNGNWGGSSTLQTPQQNLATNNTGVNLPGSTMSKSVDGRSLPGYEGCSTIVIDYKIPAGLQQNGHPNPGQRYDGTDRQAYLPDNSEGRDLLRLLKRAFDSGLTFTIGRSQTTGRDNQVIWNGIPHKTNIRGGKQSFGYPDMNYFNELRQTLSTKGIL